MGLYTIWQTIYKFIICLVLTMCFYVPGLIYAINDLACRARIKVDETTYTHNSQAMFFMNKVLLFL